MKPSSAAALALDHLIVAARSLDEGAQFVAERLGMEPVTGGAHARMGTHNRLLGLAGGVYLEVIAVDREAQASASRWFELDTPAMQARLERGPFLAHWATRVGRPKDLGRWQAQYPSRIAPVIAMSRGELSWRITVPVDGAFPSWQGAGDGIAPTLIQWDTPLTPAQRLPNSGLALRSLKGSHPRADLIREQLAWLGADHLIDIEDAPNQPPALVAEIETPEGVRVLR